MGRVAQREPGTFPGLAYSGRAGARGWGSPGLRGLRPEPARLADRPRAQRPVRRPSQYAAWPARRSARSYLELSLPLIEVSKFTPSARPLTAFALWSLAH